MKVGIITLAGGENYGGQLQNFAVTKAYESLGLQAVTIPDVTKNGVKSTYNKVSKKSKLKPSYITAVMRVRTKQKYLIKNQRDHLIPSIIRKKKNASRYALAKKKRTEAFRDFYDNLVGHTDFTISKNNIPKDKLSEFDFFSAGSDQIWNPTYPHTSEIKFLTFAENSKKLTFAPSFGISQLPTFAKEPYAKWLMEIPNLSVREEQGAEIIKELTGRQAQVICDPTFTVTRDVWESIEKKPDFSTDKPYALTYFLGNESNKYRRYISSVAEEKNLTVINLFDIRDSEYFSAGPAEFLYLIHHADAVFTDSFHAAVFSIIFKRDFVVFDRIEDGRSMGSRLKTLLGTFSLSDRMYNEISKNDFSPVDFGRSDDIIARERETALNFLKKSIYG